MLESNRLMWHAATAVSTLCDSVNSEQRLLELVARKRQGITKHTLADWGDLLATEAQAIALSGCELISQAALVCTLWAQHYANSNMWRLHC
jgi:hypothetical protein